MTNTACRFLQQVYCVTSYVGFFVFVHVPQCSAFVTSFFAGYKLPFRAEICIGYHNHILWQKSKFDAVPKPVLNKDKYLLSYSGFKM